jgi:putative transposase
MNRTYNYPLRPTEAQEAVLELWLWRCRELYNAALEEKITAYKKLGKSPSRYDQQKALTAIRKELPGFAGIPAVILRSALIRLDRSYDNFFRRVKEGAKPGFPRFKGRDQFKSFSLQQEIRIDGDTINIPKLGYVKFHQYRPLKGIPKDAIFKKTAKGWAVSIQCDLGEAPEKPTTEAKPIGIDLGLKTFASLSNGEQVANPRFAKKAAHQIAELQRILDRKKRGSKSRHKAKLALVTKYEQVRNQRIDFARKLAAELFKRFDLVVFERLNIIGMITEKKLDPVTGKPVRKTPKQLRKSILDASWRQFTQCLENKAEEAGLRAIGVDPRNTTQMCSACGKLPTVKITLKDRVYNCEHCGHSQDRDLNAALNIEALGLSALTPEVTREDAEPLEKAKPLKTLRQSRPVRSP